MGIQINKYQPKLVFHDLSIADSNLDHLAGSDNSHYFVYLSSKSQKNVRLVNSRTRKVLVRTKVDTKSVFDIFGNNRFIQFGGGQTLKILDLHYRRFLPLDISFEDRFFHCYHKFTNRLICIDLKYVSKGLDSSEVCYTFWYHQLEHGGPTKTISESKKFLKLNMTYDNEGDMRIIAKQNRKIKVFEIDGYCYIFIVTLSQVRLLLIVLDPELKCIKIEKLKNCLKEPVVNHIMAWLGKSKRSKNQDKHSKKLMYASNYSTSGEILIKIDN